MTGNPPRGKIFTLQNCWGSNISPSKKGNYYSNLPPSVLVSFNKWKIIQFTNKKISNEYFYAVNEVVVNGINDNMVSLARLGKYGDINASDTTTMGYYVINYLSELSPYSLGHVYVPYTPCV